MLSHDPICSVKDKPAVITGASSGLGVTFAQILAERGANVVLSARRVENLDNLKESLDSENFSSMVAQCDVTE